MKCAFCGHAEKDHRPPAEIDTAKTGSSSGRHTMTKVVAKTHCYLNPLCCCVKFIAPIEAQGVLFGGRHGQAA